MDSRYRKQELFSPIGKKGQQSLSKSKVAILGIGALGSFSLNLLARAGVGFIRIIDRDIVETDNLQRQILFDEKDAKEGSPKVIAAKKKISSINSEVHIDTYFSDFNPSNAETCLSGIDLVLDCTDNFETRFLLNDVCHKLGKNWIYSACLGSYGLVMNIISKEICFRCVIDNIPAPGSVATCDTAGILNSTVGIISSFQVTEALKFLTGNFDQLLKKLLVIECWNNETKYLGVHQNKSCQVCSRNEYEFLSKETSGTTIKLCGRNAIYINPGQLYNLELKTLSDRLQSFAQTKLNEYMLTFKVDDLEVHFFSDGRAIIKGTEDTARARTIYSKYIGT
ncbi:MAG: ThiF family adenylyltransferase [Planctomycetes bacterium]|nr:ThiF family adenylyltransferase [Planctomycetota bacterium]